MGRWWARRRDQRRADLAAARRLREQAEAAERHAEREVRIPMAELRQVNHIAADIVTLSRRGGHLA